MFNPQQRAKESDTNCKNLQTIKFEQFVKTYVTFNRNGQIATPEDNLKSFKATVTQPSLLAVGSEAPIIMQKLLDFDVDSSTLTPKAQDILQNPAGYSYLTGQTVFDIIRAKINERVQG